MRIFHLPYAASASHPFMADDGMELPITSSDEPIWAADAQECYKGVLCGLLQANIPFAVSGGFAFHHHTGIWRVTKDLDLVVPPDAVPRAFEVLTQKGFETYVQDPVWLGKARLGDYFVDLITGVGNATLTVDQSWIDRAQEAHVLGIRCKILPVEEMIASKMFVTRRERFDGADIAHLLRACSHSLCWDRLRFLVGQHWQMLYWALVLFAFIYPARTADVPANIWRELTERFRQSVRPQQDQPFRGTLVDPRMFAIDVNEWGERDLYRELCDNYSHPLQETHTTRSKE